MQQENVALTSCLPETADLIAEGEEPSLQITRALLRRAFDDSRLSYTALGLYCWLHNAGVSRRTKANVFSARQFAQHVTHCAMAELERLGYILKPSEVEEDTIQILRPQSLKG